jgi:galactokinase
VVSEIERVERAIHCLEDGDSDTFGEIMVATHASLRDDYEVSCPELDALVEIATGLEGCLGARLTGAGFGGCTVSLVKTDQVDDFVRGLAKEYHRRTGLTAPVFVTQASQGAQIL